MSSSDSDAPEEFTSEQVRFILSYEIIIFLFFNWEIIYVFSEFFRGCNKMKR